MGIHKVEVRLRQLLLCYRSLTSWNRGPPCIFLIHSLQSKSASPFRLGSGRSYHTHFSGYGVTRVVMELRQNPDDCG
jgi:hypothetical protein